MKSLNLIEENILKITQAKAIEKIEVIQNLWSNYGELKRIYLHGGEHPSVILKHIQIPKEQIHPRGFGGNLSNQRKINSYKVETTWYEKQNKINLKDNQSPTPRCLDSFQRDGEFFILMEDLNSQGFSERPDALSFEEVKVVLNWLATFHAKFLNNDGEGLWDSGTYWHLETRPNELMALEDQALKRIAPLIDQRLKACSYSTLVHGDAKLANFCFSKDIKKVAAVDFQYIGKGCGVKDVAYFIGSCFHQEECEKFEDQILDYYFKVLKENIKDNNIDKNLLEKQWRDLYYFAWADFHRFLKGWSPGHWKVNSYSEKICQRIIHEIETELLEVAKEAALRAGNLIMSYWKKDFEVSTKEGNSLSASVVTEVDNHSQNIILQTLHSSIQKFDLGLLAEESLDDGSRFKKSHFWCIDPLDGTLYFSEGKEGFSISIALISKEGDPFIGVVYDPVKEELFTSIQDKGSFLNGKGIEKKELDHPTIFSDRSLKKASDFSELQEKFNIRFESGAVLNALKVLRHKNSAYFKYPKPQKGGCAIWDLAAVFRILDEEEVLLSAFDGSELNFNPKESIYYNHRGLMCSRLEGDDKLL